MTFNFKAAIVCLIMNDRDGKEIRVASVCFSSSSIHLLWLTTPSAMQATHELPFQMSWLLSRCWSRQWWRWRANRGPVASWWSPAGAGLGRGGPVTPADWWEDTGEEVESDMAGWQQAHLLKWKGLRDQRGVTVWENRKQDSKRNKKWLSR